MTIYAKWKINSYTINYFSNGGTEIEPVRYEYNADISAPTAPTKEGYILMTGILTLHSKKYLSLIRCRHAI